MTWRFGGADLSHHNADAGTVEFDVLQAGSLDDYCATKMSQRNNYLDPTFETHRDKMRRARFRYRPLYHWQSPVIEASISSQYAHIQRCAGDGGFEIGEAFMSDSEQFGITEPETWELLNLVEHGITKRPSIVYLGLYIDGGKLYRSDRIRMSDFGQRAIHLAAYTTEMALAMKKFTLGLTKYSDELNQWGSGGVLPDGTHVPGVIGRTDMNQVNNFELLEACCGYAAQPIGDEMDMYIATLRDGTIVIVGDNVRPVSSEEIAANGPLADLPRFAPSSGSNWHAWLAAGAAEYERRIFATPSSPTDPAPFDLDALAAKVAAKIVIPPHSTHGTWTES